MYGTKASYEIAFIWPLNGTWSTSRKKGYFRYITNIHHWHIVFTYLISFSHITYRDISFSMTYIRNITKKAFFPPNFLYECRAKLPSHPPLPSTGNMAFLLLTRRLLYPQTDCTRPSKMLWKGSSGMRIDRRAIYRARGQTWLTTTSQNVWIISPHLCDPFFVKEVIQWFFAMNGTHPLPWYLIGILRTLGNGKCFPIKDHSRQCSDVDSDDCLVCLITL